MTRRWIALCTATLLLAILGGCDTLSRAQFQIPNPSGRDENRDRVVAVVQAAAINAGLVDHTGRSKAEGTLIYFEESLKYAPTTLGARTSGEYLIIDLTCFHPGGDAPPSFTVTKRELENSLKAEFGGDWRLAGGRSDWIPVTYRSDTSSK